MSIPQWFAGQVITADRLNARNFYLVTQENDLQVDQGTTVMDTEIVIPVETGAVYAYWCWISYTADNNTDSALDYFWDAPTSTALCRFTQSYGQTPTASINDAQGVIFRRPGNTTRIPAGGTGGDSYHSAYDQGTITVGATSGNVVLRVAQNVHGGVAANTILRGGNQTRCLYQRIA